jgi:hypothetical protein
VSRPTILTIDCSIPRRRGVSRPPRRGAAAGRLLFVGGLALLNAASGACGKKGPPLAPLRLFPAAVAETDARRSGSNVELRFGLPTANANGPGPLDLGRVEIYAVTIGPGAAEPPNPDLLAKERLVGTIEVKPPPVPGEDVPTDNATPPPSDTRPAPGERVTFVEELSEAKLKPVILKVQGPGTGGQGSAAPPAAGGAAPPATAAPGAATSGAPPATADPAAAKPDEPPATPPAAAPGAATQPAPGQTAQKPADPSTPAPGAPAAAGTATPGQPGVAAQVPVPDPIAAAAASRIYAIRGITRGGRPGLPVRVRIPLVDPPTPPSGVAARFTETTIALDWTPPVGDVGGSPLTFNVYPAAQGAGAINSAPLTAPAFEQPIPEMGKEHCLVVRSVRTVAGVSIESESSAPACTTPTDIFPPAPPAGLQAVATTDGVNLSWEASAAPDLAGYVLLRGDSPDGTLQPLTPEPISETTFRDATVKPGATYVYAVVAVDRATPPNTSARSGTATVTAR